MNSVRAWSAAAAAALALTFTAAARAEPPDDPAGLIQRFDRLDLDAKAVPTRTQTDFDAVSKDRIDIELRLVACGKAAASHLVRALESDRPHLRRLAAHLLGVLGDASIVPALQAATRSEDVTERIYALQSLAWLHAGTEEIEEAARSEDENVAFMADRAREQLRAEPPRPADFAPLPREQMDSARVGAPAPNFVLPTSDGKPWRLSEQTGIVVLMFQLADW